MKMDSAVGDGNAHVGGLTAFFDSVHGAVMVWIFARSFLSAEFFRFSLDVILQVQAIAVMCLRGDASRTSTVFLRL